MNYKQALIHAARSARKLDKDIVVFTYSDGDVGVASLENWDDPTRLGESSEYWEGCEVIEVVKAENNTDNIGEVHQNSTDLYDIWWTSGGEPQIVETLPFSSSEEAERYASDMDFEDNEYWATVAKGND